mmetsp:Transcript_95573/g.270581  ORF Transcript_95573/g.270581 Transcript_95573/m.270581 type:complete len:281 (-) Transcript_95573:50-892(-)|eukprot:CAMPEP_0179246360 /NCGR_PEP_ID=MMETSP0797-20121207/19055_1 /TAXON_ID=47934 /ORGANISM="Dinophysis acuminata, Strain DAEP01" /LENGTH=280 /DNA_ID=CAMNT_0020953949 /DNA_START=47 /DNA_END=889 /DNA_ORIENTATION=-
MPDEVAGPADPAEESTKEPAEAVPKAPAQVGDRPRAWLEIDINDTRAAYQLAKDFVAAKNLAYNLSSDLLERLSGSEKKRVKADLFPSCFEWASRGRIAVVMPPERITFELWPDVAPLAVQNFLSLCTGHKGVGGGGKPLHYKSCNVHRIVKDFIVQGGDILMGNGTGGESVYGKAFKDDKAGLKVKIDKRGLLAMGNSGKNSNTSQFFITLAGGKKLERLTGNHVVFGEIVDGEKVLSLIDQCADEDGGEKPRVSVVIADSGVYPETMNDLQKHQAGLS